MSGHGRIRASKAEVARQVGPLAPPLAGRTAAASRVLSIRFAAAECREETYLGESHLVVPVIPLYGNLVFFPTGAEGYELVPDYVVAQCPIGWDNRPVVPIHPGGDLLSANSPEFLAQYCFGQLFNTEYGDDGKLHTEAWLSRYRAAQVGQLALDVIAKCERGEEVEVSVGAHIQFERRAGTYQDKSYVGVWRAMVPDHLAMGLNGKEGACSVSMGCGGPRLAIGDGNMHSFVSEHSGVFGDPIPRMAVRSKARRPTFKGTETGAWSKPSLADYIAAFYDGDADSKPSSVGDLSSALKGRIAACTLLGDASADTFGELSALPVVNPKSGKLNGAALRNAAARVSQISGITAAAVKSVQSMVSSLLKSEFGSDGKSESKSSKSARGDLMSITAPLRSLLKSIRLSATPADDAEEAAELIAYQSISDLVGQASDNLGKADAEVKLLMSSETETPTTTDEGEQTEETIEIARFSRIRSLLYAAGSDIYSAADVVADLYREHVKARDIENAADGDGVTPVVIVGDTRYYASGADRNAAGARHSKSDMAMIQKTHDMTVKLGASCPPGDADGSGTDSTNKTATAGMPAPTKPCGCNNRASLF